MWSDRHRTRREARLRDRVLRVGLDEVARFLERADPPVSPNAPPTRLVLAAIAWPLRGGGVASPAYGLSAPTQGLRLVPALDREGSVREPDAGPGPSATGTLRTPADAPAGDHRHAERRGPRRARAIVPANVQDRDTPTALEPGKVEWPSLRLAIPGCRLHG